jgi:superfamily I DNA/RNA helicase
MEFNEDGSLKIPKNVLKDLESLETETPDHIKVLRLINELEFSVGKKFLAEILKGERNSKIKKFSFQNLLNHGALDLYDYRDIYELIDKMILNGIIEVAKLPQNKFMPVIKITPKGKQELSNPENTTLNTFSKCIQKTTEITEQDKEVFKQLDFFLGKFNPEQKKAIIETNPNILCIAGAGSGKTTVLTKRIEFLVKYKNTPSNKILAITFTRKARQEMITRLQELLPNNEVQIETFNSFCEKQLQLHRELETTNKVMDFSSKIRATTQALSELGYSPEQIVQDYFSDHKIRNTELRNLYFTFVNDIFSVMDHYKYNQRSYNNLQEISQRCATENKHLCNIIYQIITSIKEHKEKNNLRDYTDQIIHTIKLYKEHNDIIPKFEHVLVDEYQDVNDIQVELINELKPSNLFVVGDPRQSIYGWRGSKIENILIFPEKYENASVIQLTMNYRSTNNLVELGNQIIKSMSLPDLKSQDDDSKPITLIAHPSEQAEHMFITQSILSQSIPRNEIFILARTNKQLDNIANVLDQNNIKYLKRTVEEKKENLEPKEDEITLSTVHAIKGLEAELVYMIGVNSLMYPCITSEHPVLNLVKIDDDYDKYAEELRLLYVGLTRAKKQLVISHYGNLSKFITSDIQKLTNQVGKKNSTYKISQSSENLHSRIRSWRANLARELNTKPYMIFSDKTLEALVQKRPSQFYELQDIYGLGPHKVMKFGEELLDIINLR